MREKEIDMSIWNHRLVDMTKENGGDPLIAIREVHYNDDGKPVGHTEPFMCGDDMDGVRTLLKRLNDVVNFPILKSEDFTGEFL